jgi:hypothetical protein
MELQQDVSAAVLSKTIATHLNISSKMLPAEDSVKLPVGAIEEIDEHLLEPAFMKVRCNFRFRGDWFRFNKNCTRLHSGEGKGCGVFRGNREKNGLRPGGKDGVEHAAATGSECSGFFKHHGHPLQHLVELCAFGYPVEKRLLVRRADRLRKIYRPFTDAEERGSGVGTFPRLYCCRVPQSREAVYLGKIGGMRMVKKSEKILVHYWRLTGQKNASLLEIEERIREIPHILHEFGWTVALPEMVSIGVVFQCSGNPNSHAGAVRQRNLG